MDFYGILFDIKNGSKMPYSKNYFDTLFAQKLEELGVKTITGTLPLTFTTSETALRSWTIYGNNYEHKYSTSGTLPLTFTTHTAGAASDWSISGNDNVGKNKLEITAETQTINGVTFTVDKTTGTIAINGTASVVTRFPVSIVTTGDFYFSCQMPRGSNNTYYLYVYDRTTGANVKTWDGVTTTSSIYDSDSYEVKIVDGHETTAYIRIAKGYIANNVVFKPMLRPANTSPDFEPYQIGVGQRTKNQLEITVETQTINGVTFTVDKTKGTITANGTANSYAFIQFPVDLNTGVYLCTIYSTGSNVGANLRASSSGTPFIASFSESGYSLTLTQSNRYIVRVAVPEGTTATNEKIELMIRPADTSAGFIPFGYEIPLTVSQSGQTDKNYDIYIGDSPLTEGETVSKQSTGVDLELFEGINTVSTSLYNKPETSITYTDYIGVGKYVNGQWQIPLTVSHITDNIFDKDAKNTNKGYEDSTCIMWAGSIPYPYMTGNEDNNYFVSEKIPCSPNTTYYLTDGIFKNTDNGIYSVFLWNRYRMSDYQAFPTEKTFTTGDDTRYIQVCVLKTYADTVMITTKPTETYIPHVEVNNVNVPIDAPLTASDTATQTSTGVDIPTYVDTNTISTTLENKPEMTITYKGG